ncbi:hypothetical protein GF323_05735 [Candidatus Woesearchaeota archaeon]|nr:hypothetical protein [Candidatus Woesearchaeota archaeon]
MSCSAPCAPKEDVEMAAPSVIKETPMSIAEVKAEIEKIKKRDKELGFRTQRTEEYINHFAKRESLKLADALRKMNITRLKDEHIVKIADLMPKTVDELKVILQGYTVTVTKDNLSKIIDEVKKAA